MQICSTICRSLVDTMYYRPYIPRHIHAYFVSNTYLFVQAMLVSCANLVSIVGAMEPPPHPPLPSHLRLPQPSIPAGSTLLSITSSEKMPPLVDDPYAPARNLGGWCMKYRARDQDSRQCFRDSCSVQHGGIDCKYCKVIPLLLKFNS